MRSVQENAGLANVRAKLGALDLLRFVGPEPDSEPGALNFECTDVGALHAALDGRRFTPVRTRRWGWESRERRARASLHLKHFAGWEPSRVQAHVDPIGIPPHWWWWLFPPLALALVLLHAFDSRGYADTRRVRTALLRSGVSSDMLA